MIQFWDIIERAEQGKSLDVNEWDRLIGKTAAEVVSKFDLKFDPDNPVPADDALADRLYEAGIELFARMGIYCIDTGKVLQFSSQEILEALENAPDHVIYGSGPNTVDIPHRTVEDPRDPIVNFSAVGTPVTEELFVPVCQSYAQEPMADTFSGPLITQFRGIGVSSGSPVEVEAGIWNVVKLREAARWAGRPEMPIHNFMSIAERTDATIAAARPELGALPGDGLFVAAVAELKVDYERLKKVSFLLHSPYVIGGLYGPLMGGFGGGPAATAALLVAHHALGVLAFRAPRHNAFPVHIHNVCNTSREMLWLVSVTGQALARNTHLVTFANAFMASGPCTEMILWELSAHSLTATVSGWHLNPCAVAKNRQPLHCSAMEPRIHAEVGHVAARGRLDRKEACRIVNALLDKYEKQISQAPIGKSFTECYDPVLVRPRDEYLKLWEGGKKELAKLGLDFGLIHQ
jgi:methylamine--corrinoid protein Co-methyltransferase